MCSKIKEFLTSKYLAFVLRLLLGIMFIISAQSKLADHTQFVVIVKDYEILPDFLADAYGNSLPWIELLVGVYLLLAIFTRTSAVIALLMGISFMVANTTAVWRGDLHCGNCFGELVTLPVEQAIAIDVFLIFATFILVFFPPDKHILGLETLFTSKHVESPNSADLEAN